MSVQTEALIMLGVFLLIAILLITLIPDEE
jgi:hypothetical protein